MNINYAKVFKTYIEAKKYSKEMELCWINVEVLKNLNYFGELDGFIISVEDGEKLLCDDGYVK